MVDYENPWLLRGKPFTSDKIEKNVAFVYLITNLTNNRMYIGKKSLYMTKTRQVKGKKKRSKVESLWKKYYGSNEELMEDVKKLGEKNFKREIIRLCKSKSEASYYEAAEQFKSNVLLSDKFYNAWIMVKVRASNLRTMVDNSKNKV